MKLDENQNPGITFSYIAAAVTGVIATLVFLILPIMVGGIADQFDWGEKEIGWLASADMGGSALASLVLAAFITRIHWKKAIRVAVCFVVIGNLVSIFLDSLTSLLLVRVLTGLSNGVIMSVVFATLCRSPDPDRYFGVYVFTQLTLQAVLLPLLPGVLEAWGTSSVYLLLASASAASAFLAQFFPPQIASGIHTPALTRRLSKVSSIGLSRWGVLTLLAQAIYFLAPAAIWAYFEVIGETFSLTLAEIGDALGLAALAGMLGALCVVLLANRSNRNWSMTIGTGISLIAVGLLMQGSGFYSFLLAAALMNFSWNYTFPYQMGSLSLFDRNGAVAVLSLVVQTFGLSVGPVLASLFLLGKDFSVVFLVCIGCYLISLLMFLGSSFFGSKKELVLA